MGLLATVARTRLLSVSTLLFAAAILTCGLNWAQNGDSHQNELTAAGQPPNLVSKWLRLLKAAAYFPAAQSGSLLLSWTNPSSPGNFQLKVFAKPSVEAGSCVGALQLLLKPAVVAQLREAMECSSARESRQPIFSTPSASPDQQGKLLLTVKFEEPAIKQYRQEWLPCQSDSLALNPMRLPPPPKGLRQGCQSPSL